MDDSIIPGRYCCFKNHFKPVSHVIFDLDGTLLDTEKIDIKVFQELASELGSEYTEEIHETILGRNECDACKMIVDLLELEIEYEEFEQRFQEKNYKRVPDAAYMPGALDLVTHLHEQHIPMAIATSSTEKAVESKASKKEDFFKMFDHIVCGSTDPEVLRGKPYPNIYFVAARRFPERPCHNKCLVFEDAFNGVRAALGAGMQVVMTPTPKTSYDKWKYATLRLDSLKQFIPELFGLPAFGSPIPQPKLKVEVLDPAEIRKN